MPPASDKPRLALFDGHGIIHRAYYALKDNPLSVRRTGEQTSATFGFVNTLLAVMDDLKPTHVMVAMDLPGPTFRHERDATYKATRFEGLKGQVARSLAGVPGLSDAVKEQVAEAVLAAESREQIKRSLQETAAAADVAPEAREELARALDPVEAVWDISRQMGRCLEMMDAFDIPAYSAKGYEADDVLGALSVQAAAAGIETYVVTLDTDLIQLIQPNVNIYMLRPYQRDMVLYNEETARERYGFDPPRMADYKGLRGDSSDNIPGVPGIGDTTAKKLLIEYGDIDGIFENIDKVKPDKVRLALIENEAQVRRSTEMATIERDVPDIVLDMSHGIVGRYDRQRVLTLLRDLEFRSLVPRLPPLVEDLGKAAGDGAATSQTRYSIVSTDAELAALLARLGEVQRFAFDLELKRVGQFDRSVIGVAIAVAEGEAYYIPVGHQGELGGPSQLPADVVLDRLAPFFADESVEVVSHDGKGDLAFLNSRGYVTAGDAFDTIIAAYILGEGGGSDGGGGSGSLGLRWLVSRRLGFEMAELINLIGRPGVKQLTLDQVRIEDALPYVCANVDMTLRLRGPLEQDLREQGMWDLFSKIETPLVPVLARMEAAGVAFDVAVMRDMSRGLNEQIEFLEAKARSDVGHEFNLGSPPQLSQVLFEEIGLPKTRKTKQGYSTDAQSIEALRGVHPIIETLLEWRGLTKLRSTYIDALPVSVNPRDNRIHTTFLQTVAATGRLSSTDPNLQNIPVRSELGGQVRRAFIARDIGADPYLLSADYSQIELRILAHMSQDPGLLEAFRNDEDIHRATASQVFGVEMDAVTKVQRDRAKVFNFGVLYGLSEFGLAAREGISREEAGVFIKRYFEKYESVKRWRDGIVASTRENGYAETLAGRRRYIPDIHSPNFNIRSAAERVAINMPVQGTASDIIKIAMVAIDAEIRERQMESRMLLQVHDELIFEGPQSELDALRELVLRIMPASLKLDVPLKVDVKAGKNWADME
jgi:DNA polymerase-1